MTIAHYTLDLSLKRKPKAVLYDSRQLTTKCCSRIESGWSRIIVQDFRIEDVFASWMLDERREVVTEGKARLRSCRTLDIVDEWS